MLCKGSFSFQSGRLDLNQRPPAPEAGALPGYATPRNTTRRPSTRGMLTHVNTHSRLTGARNATRFAVCKGSRKSRQTER